MSGKERSRRRLEELVEERTRQLEASNERLRGEIADRKRVEVELEEARAHAESSAAQLRIMIENMAERVCVSDHEGNVILINEAMRRSYGIDEGNVPRRVSDMWETLEVYDLDGRLLPLAEWPISRILRGERVSATELRIRFKVTGKEFAFSYNGAPIRDGSGKIVMGVFTSEDITEHKRAAAVEEQLRHSQKMEAVGLLAGGVAHDFNNLLMVIRSYAERLQEKFSEGDGSRKRTQQILRAVERAASLTTQLLAFSRKQIASPEIVDLNKVIAEAVKMLGRMVGEDVELTFQAGESLWLTRADPDQIVQILMNLCVNSRDAMPSGGKLAIATENVNAGEPGWEHREHAAVTPGEYVRFSVADTGVGMNKELMSRIFEPFFTTKEIKKGTGLGLSTVYGIVKQSNGHIFVDSELGKGTRFTVYLPRVAEPATTAVVQETGHYEAGTERLLVVEDEDSLRECVVDFLLGLGYQVLEASSGQQALAVMAEVGANIDLLLTDVVMPQISGRELAGMIESMNPGVKTIYMSGYTDDEVVRHGVREAGVMLLQKPFSMPTLARKIREAMDRGN
jgi:two-component system, cell cycle sensor histidine kinase and response regulator CckA